MWPASVIYRTKSSVYPGLQVKKASVVPAIKIGSKHESAGKVKTVDIRYEDEKRLDSVYDVTVETLRKERQRRDDALRKPYSVSEAEKVSDKKETQIKIALKSDETKFFILTCALPLLADKYPTYAIIRRNMIRQKVPTTLFQESNYKDESWCFVNEFGININSIQEAILRPEKPEILIQLCSARNQEDCSQKNNDTVEAKHTCIRILKEIAKLVGRNFLFHTVMPSLAKGKEDPVDIQEVISLTLRMSKQGRFSTGLHSGISLRQIEAKLSELKTITNQLPQDEKHFTLKKAETQFDEKFAQPRISRRARNSENEVIEVLRALENDGFTTTLHMSELIFSNANKALRPGDNATMKKNKLEGKIKRVITSEGRCTFHARISLIKIFEKMDPSCNGYVDVDAFITTIGSYLPSFSLHEPAKMKIILRRFLTPQKKLSYRSLMRSCFPEKFACPIEEAACKLRKNLLQSSFGGIELRKIFSQFDKSKDGKVSTAELYLLLERFNIGLTREEYLQLLQKFDPDCTNEITLSHFEAFCANGVGRWADLPTIIDDFVLAVKDEFFNTKERPNGVDLSAAFDCFDVDKDGYVSIKDIQITLQDRFPKLAGLHKTELYRLMEASGSLNEISSTVDKNDSEYGLNEESFRSLLSQGTYGDRDNYRKFSTDIRKKLNDIWHKHSSFREIFDAHFNDKNSGSLTPSSLQRGAKESCNIVVSKEQGFLILEMFGTRNEKVTFQDFLEFVAPDIIPNDSEILISLRRTLRKKSLAGIALRNVFNRSFMPDEFGLVTADKFRLGIRAMGFDLSDRQINQVMQAFPSKPNSTKKYPNTSRSGWKINFNQFVCFVLANNEEMTGISANGKTENVVAPNYDNTANCLDNAKTNGRRQIAAHFGHSRIY